MLWDLVRDFFVQNIFGGTLSDGFTQFNASFGRVVTYLDGSVDDTGMFNTIDVLGSIGSDPEGYQYFINMGDYLSTIATIITMVIIVTLCSLFIWKIIKLVGGLLR